LVHSNIADLCSAIDIQGVGIIKRTSIYNNSLGGQSAICNGAKLLLEDSDVHDNSVSFGTNPGGINNRSGGVLAIVSSTVARNQGGGISNTGDLFLRSVTVASNTVTVAGGIVPTGISNTGTARVEATIVALNTDTISGPSDCNDFTSMGDNLIGNITGCAVHLAATDHVGDPGLGAFIVDSSLAGSGHFPLLLSSPAVNATTGGECTPRDQVGDSRIKACDVGAVELHLQDLRQ
jgi:hypothetical protein